MLAARARDRHLPTSPSSRTSARPCGPARHPVRRRHAGGDDPRRRTTPAPSFAPDRVDRRHHRARHPPAIWFSNPSGPVSSRAYHRRQRPRAFTRGRHRLAGDLLRAVGTDIRPQPGSSPTPSWMPIWRTIGTARAPPPADPAGARQGTMSAPWPRSPARRSQSGATAIVDAADGWGQPANAGRQRGPRSTARVSMASAPPSSAAAITSSGRPRRRVDRRAGTHRRARLLPAVWVAVASWFVCLVRRISVGAVVRRLTAELDRSRSGRRRGSRPVCSR